MPLIHTYNSSSNPMALLGLATNSIALSNNNLLGLSIMKTTGFPVFPPPQPIYPPTGSLTQVLGLVPLNPCTDLECRSYPESEYINVVFGNPANTLDPYTNDINTFLIQVPMWYSSWYHVRMKLMELIGGVWTPIAILGSTPPNPNLGTYYPFNSISGHQEWTGYTINWESVYAIYGAGIYAIGIQVVYQPGGTVEQIIKYCGLSEPFCLKEYSCEAAYNTVKFEITLNGGTIGDAENPALLWNLCGFVYKDSIRFEGFFGYQKQEYDRKLVKYSNGSMKRVRDEITKKYDLQTGRLPKWLHDRFSTYALLSGGNTSLSNDDNLLVSDYNLNNPDYSIKRKGVLADSGYEPVWVQSTRYARVKCSFKEDQQNLIRRKCC